MSGFNLDNSSPAGALHRRHPLHVYPPESCSVLAALAPAIALKVTGLLPVLLEALSAVARAVGH